MKHRLVDDEQRREMHHRVDAMLLQRFLHPSRIANVAFHQRHPRRVCLAHRAHRQTLDGAAMALGQIVVDHHIVPGAQERPNAETADIPGASRDQDRTQRVLPMEKYVKPCAFIAAAL
jgi:hypothetical protein